MHLHILYSLMHLALCHLGVLERLVEVNFVPKIVSGSSGGAIIASIFATRPVSVENVRRSARHANMVS